MTNKINYSIPGYPEISDWPVKPALPAQIIEILIYRDGGTVGVVLEGNKGKGIDLFFDRFLGRLCFGDYHTAADAAYLKKGSKLEKEAFEYLEFARKKLSTQRFSKLEIQVFNQYFKKARIYSSISVQTY